jgi:ubiquinol-cytochrome c reductase iron-sulfur subunit
VVKSERGSDTVNHAASVDIGDVQFSNLALGLTLGFALLLTGVLVVRSSTRKSTYAPVDVVDNGPPATDSGPSRRNGERERRTLPRRSLLGLAALLPVPVLMLLGDVGRTAAARREHTIWAKGVRLVTDVSERPIRLADLEIGELVHAIPENLAELPEPDQPEAKAKAAIVLVRMEAREIRPAEGRENWHVEGIIAYSKICTHVGCPMGLYERTTKHLLCPCHQSTFDLADNGTVVFGPATRSLPQLPLAFDPDGFVVALSDFTEPVGPSYWERDA